MNNKNLNKAKKAKNDEFYTIYEQFEILTKLYLTDKLEDKIIYCPCDAEWSNIIKVLKDYKDILRYKELIYTSDDFRTHDDLFEYCDVVITNPPFSLSKEFYKKLKEHNCKFFYYGNLLDCSTQYMVNDIIQNKTIFIDLYDIDLLKIKYKEGIYKNSSADVRLNCIFICPDNTFKRVNAYIYTNLYGINKLGSDKTKLTKSLADIKQQYLDGTKILNISCWKNYPKDYLGIAAISPFKYTLWFDKFDVVCYDKKIISKYLKINGKKIFLRWFVKLKGSDAKLEDYIKDTKINKLF